MILLDTHVWVWLMDDPQRIRQPTLERIESEELLIVSAISCWEIAMLVSKNRLKLTCDIDEWIQISLTGPRFDILPLSASVARLAGSDDLPWSHTDPADRMIVATALELDIPLVTADHKIRSIEGFTTIW